MSFADNPGPTVKPQPRMARKTVSKDGPVRPSKVIASPVKAFKPDFITSHGKPIPFTPGEKLLYNVSWLKINAGFAEISVGDVTRIKGFEVFPFVARAWTNAFFSKFFTVEDTIVSWLDTTNFIPHRYEEHIREGSYSRDRIFEFNHEKRISLYKNKKFALSAQAQDPFSCLMILRMLAYSPGDTITVDVFANQRCYQIEMTIGPVQELETELGLLPCFTVKPILKLRGRVVQEDSELTIWFTDDDRRLPVKLETKVKIGTIVVKMIEYSAKRDK